MYAAEIADEVEDMVILLLHKGAEPTGKQDVSALIVFFIRIVFVDACNKIRLPQIYAYYACEIVILMLFLIIDFHRKQTVLHLWLPVRVGVLR